jgi:hypothetical protein
VLSLRNLALFLSMNLEWPILFDYRFHGCFRTPGVWITQLKRRPGSCRTRNGPDKRPEKDRCPQWNRKHVQESVPWHMLIASTHTFPSFLVLWAQ